MRRPPRPPRPAPLRCTFAEIGVRVAVVLLSGCTVEFPARGGLGDATLGHVPLGGADDGRNGRDGQTDGQVGTGPVAPPGSAPDLGSAGQPPPRPEPDPDAPDQGLGAPPEPPPPDPPDAPGSGPAPRPPRARLELVRGPSPVGCRPHDVGLSWDTAEVERCTLTKSPSEEVWDVAPLPRGTTEWPAVSGDVVFRLDCDGEDGSGISTEVQVRPVTGLQPTRYFASRQEIADEQRRCASANEQTRLPDDAANAYVRDTMESLSQICRCAGYGVVESQSSDTHCFGGGGDHLLGQWVPEEDDWLVETPGSHARCVQDLTCSSPVMYCADHYAP